MSDVHFLSAFLAGLASFLSPCVLPLVPGYLSMISGFSIESLQAGEAGAARRTLARAGLFVLGFSLVFMAMGAGASSLGQLVMAYRPILSKVAGVLIVLFGLHFAGALRIKALYRERRVHLAKLPAGPIGALLLGMAFAFGWTPCIGPILSTILMYAADQGTVGRGMALLLTYSAGLGIPFLLAAMALHKLLGVFAALKRHFRVIEIATGALLVAMGVLIYTNQLGFLSRYLGFLERFAG